MNAEPGRSIDAALMAALRDADVEAASSPTRPRVAIAYSGGADSTALLHAAALHHREGRADVVALHVHHGLAEAADAWLLHCRTQAEAFGVPFDAERIALTRRHASIEAEARTLRYGALARLCRRHGCTILMTAHHVDDQAETVLVNLARGAGVGGLAATARLRRLDELVVSRPLIDLPATVLRAYVDERALPCIDDPSNGDRRFTRNAIRLDVMPALRRIVPGIAARMARTAGHAASMQALLDEIGAEDLRQEPGADPAADLDVDTLAALSPARASNALRVWFGRRGMRAPSTSALREMLEQLLHASPNAQIELLHERRALRLYRGRVSIDSDARPHAGFVELSWSGQPSIDVPAWNGHLHFRDAAEGDGARGIDAARLRSGALTIRDRRGGERLRPHRDGPARTLKNLYQEAGVPAWMRSRLPLVFLDDHLVFAAGIGVDDSMLSVAGAAESLVRLHWQPYGAVSNEA